MENYKARQRRLDAAYLACALGTFIHGGAPIPEYLRTAFFNGYRGGRGKGSATTHRRSQPKRRLMARRAYNGRSFSARLRHH